MIGYAGFSAMQGLWFSVLMVRGFMGLAFKVSACRGFIGDLGPRQQRGAMSVL